MFFCFFFSFGNITNEQNDNKQTGSGELHWVDVTVCVGLRAAFPDNILPVWHHRLSLLCSSSSYHRVIIFIRNSGIKRQ